MPRYSVKVVSHGDVTLSVVAANADEAVEIALDSDDLEVHNEAYVQYVEDSDD